MNACIIEVFTDSSIGHFLLSSQALYQFESLSYIYFENAFNKTVICVIVFNTSYIFQNLIYIYI